MSAVQAPPITRGRPAVTFDNTRVRAFLSSFDYLFGLKGRRYGAGDVHLSIGDIFVGVSRLQTDGQASSKPLSTGRLFHILSHCDRISTAAVTEVAPELGERQVRRYAGHARVASKAIARLLAQRPWMESAVSFLAPRGTKRQTLAEAQAAIDAPYFAELRAAGLM